MSEFNHGTFLTVESLKDNPLFLAPLDFRHSEGGSWLPVFASTVRAMSGMIAVEPLVNRPGAGCMMLKEGNVRISVGTVVTPPGQVHPERYRQAADPNGSMGDDASGPADPSPVLSGVSPKQIILDRLAASSGESQGKTVLARGLTQSQWSETIKSLLATKKVTRIGKKKGTKYLLSGE